MIILLKGFFEIFSSLCSPLLEIYFNETQPFISFSCLVKLKSVQFSQINTALFFQNNLKHGWPNSLVHKILSTWKKIISRKKKSFKDIQAIVVLVALMVFSPPYTRYIVITVILVLFIVCMPTSWMLNFIHAWGTYLL